MTEPVVRVDDLVTEVGGRRLVDGLSLELRAGQVLALVGASGSGKTTTGLAVLGEAPAGATVSGRVVVDGVEVAPGRPPRPGAVAYVPQHPAAVLNPVRRVGGVLREVAERHLPGPSRSRRIRRTTVSALVTDAVRRARLPTGPELPRRYPHQLSGGQQQRVVLAQALVANPVVLVADEPTTGQDAVTRAEVVDELRALAAEGIAVLLLSHDLDVVRALAHHVIVLRAGRPVESGVAARVLSRPAHEYTRALVAAQPHVATVITDRAADTGASVGAESDDGAGNAERLRVDSLVAHHGSGRRRSAVLHEVDLTAAAGECVAIVGRSGSGKTTLARCVTGLHAATSGTVTVDGAVLAPSLRRRSRDDLAAVQYVFQDARGSFDHHRRVLDQISRTAVRLHGASPEEAADAAMATLRRVGLDEEHARRVPHGLSGGELQRAALARALLARPRVLLCDEITSGLDTLTQHGILDLLAALRAESAGTLVLISHDMGVVARLADHVVVLDAGRVVERGPAARVLAEPAHPVTRALLGVPEREPDELIAR
ncbi:peptide/nickel transport system ATP-binding protein [Streptoalloteichus tenebrarius]|uniref:Peptide/nickel transport system ATP-binding protein n=1 Tax=Streptoalloteichus tenebrarius (strain ATCC 17920 / DSM 40477 / JCM 4838 / CBS 697.72 / NBRC 16177 / NCIMB 11028 / NRRL B-12390 / A12253. 1 / ISP 5477) TaxID=1933 RepID=A0ABT1HPD8_STRSD|nr:ABC transporter ATP-binding protein [Streptoalloteichus tenebrarius]MCP2257366.1 peptide/nickel transport system ATP-binding protein [Streptoalloteichus tenebrarius]BFF04280.1 ABC transporter ATP-binding protein [Streptoalloteichus tenebrarius]